MQIKKFSTFFLLTVILFGQATATDKDTVSSSDKEKTLKTVWELYKDYCSHQIKDSMVEISCNHDLEEFNKIPLSKGNYPKVLGNLMVDLPLEEIKKVYQQYRVIQLRKINKDEEILLIGCGNNPLIPLNTLLGHSHKGMVTINPQLSMNPTIVAGFGVNDLTSILPKQHFSKFVEEAVNPIPIDDNETLKKTMEHTLKPSAKFFTVQHQIQTFIFPLTDKNGYDVLTEIKESGYKYLTEPFEDDYSPPPSPSE